MYADFASEYDETVLNGYNYTAHTAIGSFIVQQLASVDKLQVISAASLTAVSQSTTTPQVLDLGCGTGLSSAEFFNYNRSAEPNRQVPA
jgi:hypothetical protein